MAARPQHLRSVLPPRIHSALSFISEFLNTPSEKKQPSFEEICRYFNRASQTVTGEDEYTLQDDGNLGTGNYTRSITGHGTYDRVTAGPGATMPTDSGFIDYVWEQIGDPHSGTFSLTQTGDDRYDLLEAFKDVSNTQAGQTPGHMNVYPVGQTFVDPFWGWRDLRAGVDSYFDSVIAIPQGGFGTIQAAAGYVTGNGHWGQANLEAAYRRGPFGQTDDSPVAQGVVVGSLGVASASMTIATGGATIQGIRATPPHVRTAILRAVLEFGAGDLGPGGPGVRPPGGGNPPIVRPR